MSAVFIHHLWHVPIAWAGVDLFFVLSGFLITSILRRDRTSPDRMKRFYVKRICRILPPYLLLLMLTALFFTVPWSSVWWFATFLGINFGYGLQLINVKALSPLWSLAIEEQFYLFWPILVFKLSRQQLIRLSCFLILASPVLRAACTPFSSSVTFFEFLTPFRVDLLAAGSLIALLWEENPSLDNWRMASLLLMVVGTAITAIVYLPLLKSNLGLFNVVRFSSIGAVAAGAVAGSIALEEGRLVHSVLTWAPLRGLGAISYTAYLIQLPIILLLSGVPLLWLLAMCGTIGFSTVSWFFYEKPMIALGRSYGSSLRTQH